MGTDMTMKGHWNVLDRKGVQFFANITSITTHELNNSIGIINENAGLLEDLGCMAKQGTQTNIDRWLQICQKIINQVQETHEIIQKLNSFAHSTDYARATVNLNESLSLVVSLLTKHLNDKNVIVELIPAQESIEIDTCPFLFLNLVGDCLVYAADHANQERKIVIRSHQDNAGKHISLSGILLNNSENFFDDRIEQELLNLLDAEIKFQTDQSSMYIFIDIVFQINKLAKTLP